MTMSSDDRKVLGACVRRRRPARRRGVALMLVMIALGVAGASTAFYLSSRDNSAALAANARETARADWSARAGAAVAAAILETAIDWRTAATSDGALVREMPIAGATVSVVVTDLNGDPPNDDTIDVIVTATAEINGVRATTQRVVNVRPATETIESAMQPYLTEFTLYATDRLEVDDSFIGVWPSSPAARSGVPAKIGLGFTQATRMSVDSDARTNGGAVFVRSDAEVSLQAWVRSAGLAVGGVMPLTPLAVNAAVPAAMSSLTVVSGSTQTYSGPGVSQTMTPGRYASVNVRNSARATLGGATGGRYSINNLTIDSDGTLRVQGDVELEVRGTLSLGDGGTVELVDDQSSLRVYAWGDVAVENAALGAPESVGRSTSRSIDEVRYSSPSRVRVFGVGTAARTVVLSTGSVVVADIHAPLSNITIEDAALLGRATGARVRLDQGAIVMGDPSLDNRSGYTSLDGPLYNADGTPISGLESALSSFTTSAGAEALTAYVAANVASPVAVVDDGVGATPRSSRRTQTRDWPMLALSLEARAEGVTDKLSGAFINPRKLTVMLNDVAWNDPKLADVVPEDDGDDKVVDGSDVLSAGDDGGGKGGGNQKSGGLLAALLNGLLGL